MTGAEFKQRRDALRWTQSETAKALGLGIPQISAIENGRSKVTKTVAILFSAYKAGDRSEKPSSGWRDKFLTEQHAHRQSITFPHLRKE